MIEGHWLGHCRHFGRPLTPLADSQPESRNATCLEAFAQGKQPHLQKVLHGAKAALETPAGPEPVGLFAPQQIETTSQKH